MKFKNTILALGIFTIIILITVQIVLVNSIWRQKDEMFNLRYRMISQDALEMLRRRWSTDGFDTARMIISAYSDQIVKEVSSIKDSSLLAIRKNDIILFVTKVLNLEQDLSQFLSVYFERMGFEKNFNYNIVLNRFELITDYDERIPVYINEEFIGRRPPRQDESQAKERMTRINQTEILVKGDRTEGDHFRLDFDFYIDFSDKQRVILRDTAASLALSILSILVVVILFLITYRNLMEERRLSNLKTDFINNMTHELKTPLSTITVAGRTLEMEKIRKDESKIMETARLIGKQSVHLNQLINMILEISMWERTQFSIEKKKVNMEDVLKDIVESFKTGCGNCAVIKQNISLDGIIAGIDVVYFTTLMNNLLSNAVKYSDKDPVEVEVEAFAENNYINIKVADNGIGISKSDQKHIFDKFYRASSGNIHKFKGLGLGLYYVKKIAEAHGGNVSVSSKLGKGSIFTVTIPY